MWFGGGWWGDKSGYELQFIASTDRGLILEPVMKAKRDLTDKSTEDDKEIGLIGERLKELRNQRNISQVDLAKLLGVGQTALSHAETRSDMKLSTLLGYLRALGGQLEVTAFFEDLGRKRLFSNRPPRQKADEGQLTLPGFPPRGSPSGRDVVLSVKPRYADKILDGTKTVELRRRFSDAIPSGANAWIYSTTPTKAMTGRATIADVQKMPLRQMWAKHRLSVAINKHEFEAYFSGLESGYAIVLQSPRPLHTPIALVDLRSFCDFEPPQSYLYAPPQLSQLIDGDWTKALN